MLIEIGSCPATGRRENGLNQCTKWGGQLVAVQTIVPRRTADPAPSHRLNRPRQPRPDSPFSKDRGGPGLPRGEEMGAPWRTAGLNIAIDRRSEEHTSELQPRMSSSCA